MISNNEDDDVV